MKKKVILGVAIGLSIVSTNSVYANRQAKIDDVSNWLKKNLAYFCDGTKEYRDIEIKNCTLKLTSIDKVLNKHHYRKEIPLKEIDVMSVDSERQKYVVNGFREHYVSFESYNREKVFKSWETDINGNPKSTYPTFQSVGNGITCSSNKLVYARIENAIRAAAIYCGAKMDSF